MELGTFFVNQVIVHQIPKARLAEKQQRQITLSDVPSMLTDPLRNYFRERINDSLRTRPLHVEYDPAISSNVPQMVLDFFKTNGDNFVPMSQALAHYLHSVQTGSNSAGLLAVIDGTQGSGAGAGRCLSILKLEMDRALRIEPETVGGQATFALQVDEVTLNEAADVFKAAIFDRAASLADIRAIASDNQRNEYDFGSEVATFFLKFLGCRLVSTAERDTKRYIEQVDKFVNERIDDPEKKVRYDIAALADLNRNTSEIDPKEFATWNLDVEDQDSFLELFRLDDGSVPIIAKDIRLVRARLASAHIQYDNGLRLSGPRDAVRDSVSIDGDTTVISANIRHVGQQG
jgi:hypothetical protein